MLSWPTSSSMAESPPRAWTALAWRGCSHVDSGEVQADIAAKLDPFTRSVKDLCTLMERFDRREVETVGALHAESGITCSLLCRRSLLDEGDDVTCDGAKFAVPAGSTRNLRDVRWLSRCSNRSSMIQKLKIGA